VNTSNSSSAPRPIKFMFSRQAILERDDSLWGSEIRIQVDSEVSTITADSQQRFAQQLKIACGSALTRVKRDALLIKGHPSNKRPVGNRFFALKQSALLDPGILKDIIQTATLLERHHQQLVISVDSPMQSANGPLERMALIRALYYLKDSGLIKIAYNNYKAETKPERLLVDLDLYDYIKMPFPESELRLSLNIRSDLFNRIYEQMVETMSATRVSFIADNVEHADSAILAKRLPFDYFQGRYYSPADYL
jgi:hypothetical protein